MINDSMLIFQGASKNRMACLLSVPVVCGVPVFLVPGSAHRRITACACIAGLRHHGIGPHSWQGTVLAAYICAFPDASLQDGEGLGVVCNDAPGTMSCLHTSTNDAILNEALFL